MPSLPIPRDQDLLKEPGAYRLRDNIVAFWVSQGYRPDTIKVDVIEERPDTVVVRSNLRNGTPPGKPVSAIKQFAR